MHKEICRSFIVLCSLFIVIPTIIYSEKSKEDNKPQTAPTIETIQLRIEVTGGKDTTPVRGATVYIEWYEDGQTLSKEGITNRKGIAGPYTVPKGEVFIQITTNDDKWLTNGGSYHLKEREQTISVNLKEAD